MSYIGNEPIRLAKNVTVSKEYQTTKTWTLQIVGPAGLAWITIPKELKLTDPSGTNLDIKRKKQINLESLLLRPTNKVKNKLKTKNHANRRLRTNLQILWGTTKQELSNAIVSVTKGHQTSVTLKGLGFKAFYTESLTQILKQEKGKAPKIIFLEEKPTKGFLELRLGFSHKCYIQIPQKIKVTFPENKNRTTLGKSFEIILQGEKALEKKELMDFAHGIIRIKQPEVYKAKGIHLSKKLKHFQETRVKQGKVSKR